MAYRHGLHNFSKGVLSKELWGRADIAPYNAGVRQATNMLILKYGGLTKRPGTRFVYEVPDGAMRLFPFEGAYEASYVMAMGQASMRLAALGGMVVEQQIKVTAVTKANPAQVTAAYHAYAAGDEVYFENIVGMEELNGRIFEVVASTGTNTFTIDVDSTGFGTFVSSDGAIRSEAPTPPPTPPTVPPPAPDPEEPDVGGGIGLICVTVDTPILLPGGVEAAAGSLEAGMLVHTQHEHSLEWGDWPIKRISFARSDDVFEWNGLKATGDHRVWHEGEWRRMRDLGTPAKSARVAKITVATAHTYVSAGILSHNRKWDPGL